MENVKENCAGKCAITADWLLQGRLVGCVDGIRSRMSLSKHNVVGNSYVLLLLLLLQGYHVNSDEFNYNYGQAKAAVGQYSDAIEVLIFYCS